MRFQGATLTELYVSVSTHTARATPKGCRLPPTLVSSSGLPLAHNVGAGDPLPLLRRHYPTSSLSGRRRRARLLSRWPPSAAQTGRAVFPHPAFTKTLTCEGGWKESSQPSSQARTRHRAGGMAMFSTRCSATYGAGATKFVSRASRRVGERAFGRGLACSTRPNHARRG